MRILVASPLGSVIAPTLSQEFPDSTVTVAIDSVGVVNAITGKYRFDVVISDLVWNNPELEFTFDGLDVLDILRDTRRSAPVLLAAQGHSLEQDHWEEARLRPTEAVAFYEKSTGIETLIAAIRSAAEGRPVAALPRTAGPRPLYELFVGQRGTTAGRLAGAIAAGRATDAGSLARSAQVGVNTANKITSTYLGPIIQQRGEHDPELPMTLGAVYRWCGLHARYLISWCRRNGHGDVLRPEQRSPAR